MTAHPTDVPVQTGTGAPAGRASEQSQRWRTLWRVHFYSGVFAGPFLLLMAVTGLVVLYTQPIQSLTQSDLRTVSVDGEWDSFDDQAAAVGMEFPDAAIVSVVVPRDATTASEFALDDDRSVFVDPYTSEVLGTADPDGGIVGLANRLHGNLDNESLTVSLPTIAGLLGPDPVIQEFVVGDMVLEVLAVWTLVLVASGLYLWWPRRTRNAEGGRSSKALLTPRLGKAGRARWRDLHAIPGMVFAVGTIFVVVSGLFWSSYWGAGYAALADKLTPNAFGDAPSSDVVTLGDLDRFGNRINWNTGDVPVPDSPSSSASGPAAIRIGLDSVVAIARDEGMEPGYSVALPVDSVDDVGNPLYGSYTLSNSWPRKTDQARNVYLDQFTGATIGVTDVYGYGAVSRASDTLVSTHMGTQFGLVSRILMTGVCLALIWSVLSAVVMYTRRRRTGLGLPRRPRDVSLANGLIALMVVIGIVYPLWGLSALVVLGVDRFIIRAVPRLRSTFGQR